MDTTDLFQKPDIPVEVRIPEALTPLLHAHGVSASRALKLAIYALLVAHAQKECSISDLLNVQKDETMHMKRITVRVPVRAYDAFTQAAAPLSVTTALSRIGVLYTQHPETLAHV